MIPILATGRKLLLGIGHESKNDDAIALRFIDQILEDVTSDWEAVRRERLRVQDADLVSKYDLVVFVVPYNEKLKNGYALTECHARVDIEYAGSAMNPCSVLALCRNRYARKPASFVLAIQGFEWADRQELSERARRNLTAALDYFHRKFPNGEPVE